jgi:NAD(P)-dependent dehydrogenase (short-subunit alcohol dehydrogenase family)
MNASTLQNNDRSALIIGAGDATGGAIAKRFAREGLATCVTRRTAEKLAPLVEEINNGGGRAYGFASDARKEDEVIKLIDGIEREIAPIEVMVFNIGANVPCSILDETAKNISRFGRWPVSAASWWAAKSLNAWLPANAAR